MAIDASCNFIFGYDIQLSHCQCFQSKRKGQNVDEFLFIFISAVV